jgi:uncharacterized protein (DUF4415 family)
VLFQSEEPIEMRRKSIKKDVKSKTDLTKLHRKTDTDIRYEDSPATTQEFWEDAEIVIPTKKVHLSVRLDKEVVDYFKQKGSGYQSKINAVLKSYVQAHIRHAKERD